MARGVHSRAGVDIVFHERELAPQHRKRLRIVGSRNVMVGGFPRERTRRLPISSTQEVRVWPYCRGRLLILVLGAQMREIDAAGRL